MLDWLRVITEHWPTVGLVASLLIGVYLLARYYNGAEMSDMRRRVDYLDEQVRALRYRDQCYFDYIVFDEGYHQRHMLIAAEKGCEVEQHVSFLDFRDKWMRARGLQEEQEHIWR